MLTARSIRTRRPRCVEVTRPKLARLLPNSLGLRVFALYALSLVLTVGIGLGAFYRLQFARHIDDAEVSAAMLSQVLVQTIADSAVIGDYDTINKTLRKTLTRSPFASAAYIDLKGGAIRIDSPPSLKFGRAPDWLSERVGRNLEPINSVIAAGGRDYGVLRLTFAADRVSAELWDLLRGAMLLALAGLLFGLVIIGLPMFRWLRNLQRINAFEAEIREGLIDPTKVLDADAPIEIRRAFEVLSRTAASLHAQREKADVTLHAVADGVLTLDESGVVVYANPAAGAMLGYVPEALLGASLKEILPGAVREGGFEQGWRNRRVELADLPGPGAATDGVNPAQWAGAGMTGRVLDTSLAPIVAGEGQAAGFVLACHDITEAHRLDLRLREEFAKSARAIESLRSMAQRMLPASRREAFGRDGDLEVLSEALSELIHEREASRSRLVRAKLDAEASNRAKSEFLANMSHEIRTPMNAILGLSDLVLTTPLNPQQREHLRLVKSSADSLLGIINDILDFSKIEAGRLELEALEFPVSQTVSEIVAPFYQQASDKGLRLSLHVDPSVPERLSGDPLRMGQVLKNLISNAIKFTDRGTVEVRLAAMDAKLGCLRLRFDVIDSGIGIEASKLQGIFEAFEQADSSITRRFGGTGLGLTISRRLAVLMDGDLRVVSTPGRGSVFTFELSVATASQPMKATSLLAPQRPMAPVKALRVLLIEDNLINQKLALALLGQDGHQVSVAEDGQAGIVRWQSQEFDLILMDVQMPVLDGLEATRRIRAIEQRSGSHIPIVAMTANAMSGDRERCIAAGMDDYLAKPFRRTDLQEVIARAIAGRRESTDFEWLLEGADPEIVRIVGADFLWQCPAALLDIEQAALSGDRERLVRAAHSLRGMFQTFNAEDLAAMASEIEQLGRYPGTGPIDIARPMSMLRQLSTEFCAALQALQDRPLISTQETR